MSVVLLGMEEFVDSRYCGRPYEGGVVTDGSYAGGGGPASSASADPYPADLSPPAVAVLGWSTVLGALEMVSGC